MASAGQQLGDVTFHISSIANREIPALQACKESVARIRNGNFHNVRRGSRSKEIFDGDFTSLTVQDLTQAQRRLPLVRR